MNKAQARKIAFLLVLVLAVIIAVTIWIAIQYGLGSKQQELSFRKAEEIFSTLFDLEDYENISIVNAYEYIDKNHKYRYLHYLITYDELANLPMELNLESRPLSADVIETIFDAFPTPEWWQPNDVRRGFYYTGIYENMSCDIIVDSENKLYYFIVRLLH